MSKLKELERVNPLTLESDILAIEILEEVSMLNVLERIDCYKQLKFIKSWGRKKTDHITKIFECKLHLLDRVVIYNMIKLRRFEAMWRISQDDHYNLESTKLANKILHDVNGMVTEIKSSTIKAVKHIKGWTQSELNTVLDSIGPFKHGFYDEYVFVINIGKFYSRRTKTIVTKRAIYRMHHHTDANVTKNLLLFCKRVTDISEVEGVTFL